MASGLNLKNTRMAETGRKIKGPHSIGLNFSHHGAFLCSSSEHDTLRQTFDTYWGKSLSTPLVTANTTDGRLMCPSFIVPCCHAVFD